MSWSFYPPISRSFECVASKDNIKYTLKIKFSYYAPKHEKKFNKLQPKTINEFSGYPPNIPPNSIKPSLKHIHPFSKKNIYIYKKFDWLIKERHVDQGIHKEVPQNLMIYLRPTKNPKPGGEPSVTQFANPD